MDPNDNVQYFLTPSNNIVRGVLSGGKLMDAQMFLNKQNEYSNTTQLNNLMKERKNLAQGKADLRPLSRAEFANYNIPLDAGSERFVEIDGGAKKAGKKSTKKPAAKKPSMKKPSMKKQDPKTVVSAGAPEPAEKKTSLADIFREVSLRLASQTSDLIASGGDPTMQLKSDIKFFSK